MDAMQKLLAFLDRCESRGLVHSLRRSRDDAIEVSVHLSPCEYWEVEFFADGHTEFQETTGISDVLYDAEMEKKIDDKFAAMDAADREDGEPG
ncbi:MAG: hypothetical protein ACXADB_06055 [Candidatus Hermodarchaeia archaeon]|jgi:hypothetical protein